MKKYRFLVIPTLLLAAIPVFALVDPYLPREGYRLVRLLLSARPVSRLLLEEKLTPRDRAFFDLVAAIREFAFNEAGLVRNDNYTKYIETEKEYLLDVVSAAPPDGFTPYLWRYPFLGGMPYRGFFERSDARACARELRQRGYDVLVRGVAAFSSLDIVADPLYSFMKKDSPFRLASLILHEQTHATVYLRGNSGFSEEIATFVGFTGGLRFIAARYGPSSSEYRDAVAQLRDAATLRGKVLDLAVKLRELYAGSLQREEKLAAKASLIAAFRKRFDRDYARDFRTGAYRDFTRQEINNALIGKFLLYMGDLDLYERLYRARGSDLRATITLLREAASSGGDPRAYIRKLLQ